MSGLASTPPTHNRGPKCFRIAGVPLTWGKNDLLHTLQTIDPSLKDYQRLQLSLYPACCGSTQTALLNLDTCTEYFRRLKANEFNYERVVDPVSEAEVDLVIDSHFYDLTPLNTPEGEVVADVVAVTGLAGHAFGSWRSRETRRMWLKDFLPKDVKNIRIMTYGYDSSLIGHKKSGTRLADYRRNFIQQLENSRSSAKDRPIIFLGHSLGGILILQTLVESNRNPHHKSILDSTHGIFFFGMPHQGLRTDELEEMVDADSGERRNLIMQLKDGSEYLEDHKENLLRIWEGFKLKAVSFYETVKTPSVRKLESGEYARDGAEVQMVQRFSAQLYLPSEHWLPVEKNHTDIVKFASQVDTTYQTVVIHMKNFIGSTSRFKTPRAGRTVNEDSRSTTTQHPKSTYTDNFSETPKAPCNSSSGLRQEKAAGEISEFSSFKLETVIHEGYVIQQERSGEVLIESVWDDQGSIGRKGAASVRRQRRRKGGQLRAVKTLPKHLVNQELLALVTLNDYNHLFVKFLGWYDDIHYISIVMEYMEGGDLGEYIRKDPLKASADAKEITRQILKGLEVLHKKKFCHRDIKPPNILIASFDPIRLKIADFGVAKLLENTTARTGWGTDSYRAPETLHLLPEKLQKQKNVSYALDIWSLGSLVHELLTSQTPFAEYTEYNVYESDESGLVPPATNSSFKCDPNMRLLYNYCNGNIKFPVEVLEKSGVSIEGIAFVKSLLIANPKDRPTATQALQDPWLIHNVETQWGC